MDYLFPIENENLFSSQHCKNFILLSELLLLLLLIIIIIIIIINHISF